MFPAQRKIELFARPAAESCEGWDTWGEEVAHPQPERAFRHGISR
jgi:N6-adenosine-specific RNA methylase IME4